MGNVGCRRQRDRQPLQPQITPDRYVLAKATSYPAPQYPNPNPAGHPQAYYGPSMPMPGPHMDHMAHANWPQVSGGRYPCPVMLMPAPYVEHQKAVTIRNDVNLKKETLKFEPDDQNPGYFLVSFTFDATVAGR